MAEQLGYVLRETQNDDESGTCQSDKEQDCKYIHGEMRERDHP